MQDRTETVSYTHLDVYKRQVLKVREDTAVSAHLPDTADMQALRLVTICRTMFILDVRPAARN